MVKIKHTIPHKKEKKSKLPGLRKKVKPKILSHPLYGEVPMIEGTGIDASGNEYTFGPYPDPEYKPKVPPGAVAGNVDLQRFCPIHHMPHYFYVDITRNCIQCGKDFIFKAKEQKFWYETLKFNFHSNAIRCVDCRKKKRNEKSITHQMEIAYETCRQHPKDPYAKLALSEALCLYYEAFEKGDIEAAIASAREALRLDRHCVEGLYWEALAQKLAHRPKKAKELWMVFLQRAADFPRCKNLLKKAELFLKEL